MAKYYAPCEDTWPKEWPREVVDSADYERLVEQFASYREAASASIGADLSQQAIECISALQQERDDYILKQTVWEDANDKLRSADIALRRILGKIVETAQATSHSANHVIVHRQLIGDASTLLRSTADGEVTLVENDHYRYGLDSGSRSGQRFILWLIRDKRGVVWRYVGGNPIIYYRRKDAAEAAKQLDPIPGYKAVRAELTLATNSGEGKHGST